jgi:hypothetical protein
MNTEERAQFFKELKKHFPDLATAIERDYAGKNIPSTIIEIVKLLPKKK